MNKNKIWYLSTCDTCKKIMRELGINKDNSNKIFELQDIKKNNISLEDLEKIHNSTGLTYEELFNKRAKKYVKENFKSDLDFKKGILEEYTFLKRPIISYGKNHFIGNSKLEILKAKEIILG